MLKSSKNFKNQHKKLKIQIYAYCVLNDYIFKNIKILIENTFGLWKGNAW